MGKYVGDHHHVEKICAVQPPRIPYLLPGHSRSPNRAIIPRIATQEPAIHNRSNDIEADHAPRNIIIQSRPIPPLRAPLHPPSKYSLAETVIEAAVRKSTRDNKGLHD